MKPAIIAEDVSKRYRIGADRGGSYRTLADTITEGAAAQWRRLRHLGRSGESRGIGRSGSQEFWALKDVSFTIQPGDVVGFIGRNGAGKSTLLKILSRITMPTSGRVTLRGRVSSLLEVGTGFHPELTGRENVYLSGSILGMKHAEIRRKFDEIAAFSEIERFLDTPVKRYSSGMYVRLAFAVAAHLEPEILIVDEVLAVGDMAFQKKCLGKIREVGRGGRTVLLVSHSMDTIGALCSVAVRLDCGRVVDYGNAAEQVSRYIRSAGENSHQALEARKDRTGTGEARITNAQFHGRYGNVVDHALCGDPIQIKLRYQSGDRLARPVIHAALFNEQGLQVTFLSSACTGDVLRELPPSGELICDIPELPLAPGPYLLNVCLELDGREADHVAGVAQLRLEAGRFFPNGEVPPASLGSFLCRHRWTASDSPGLRNPGRADDQLARIEG